MIGNTRQLAIAKRRLQELVSAWNASDDVLNNATYSQIAADLRKEIGEFEAIRDGLVREFKVESVDELGDATVKARIASGLNQRQLAEELDVSEQAVQKDEANLYERASLARIAEILDALGHELVGIVRPAGARAPDGFSTAPQLAVQGRVRPAPTEANRQNNPVRGVVVYSTATAGAASPVVGATTAIGLINTTSIRFDQPSGIS